MLWSGCVCVSLEQALSAPAAVMGIAPVPPTLPFLPVSHILQLCGFRCCSDVVNESSSVGSCEDLLVVHVEHRGAAISCAVDL